MTNWNAVTERALGRRYVADTWDVQPGANCPEDMAVCQAYGSVLGALDVLRAAGFAPARHAIPAPGLSGPCDLTSMMRFSAGDGQDVVLVRRLAARP